MSEGVTAHPWKNTLQQRESITASCSAITTRKPALSSIVMALCPLLEAKDQLQQELIATVFSKAADRPEEATCVTGNARFTNRAVIPPTPDTSRLANGVPVLAETDLAWVSLLFPEVLQALQPAMTILPLVQQALNSLLESIATERVTPEACATAYLDNNRKGLQQVAEHVGIPPELLVFLTQQTLGPIIGAYAQQQKHIADSPWQEGYCPVCGSFPSVGLLARKDPNQSEYLSGGGGQKYLHCSLCSHEWRYKRGTCPACNNSETGAIEYMHTPDTPWEHIEFCKKCNSYLNTINLRETTENLHLHAAAIGMMHLDIYAAEQGLHPIAPQIWNTFS